MYIAVWLSGGIPLLAMILSTMHRAVGLSLRAFRLSDPARRTVHSRLGMRGIGIVISIGIGICRLCVICIIHVTMCTHLLV